MHLLKLDGQTSCTMIFRGFLPVLLKRCLKRLEYQSDGFEAEP